MNDSHIHFFLNKQIKKNKMNDSHINFFLINNRSQFGFFLGNQIESQVSYGSKLF